MIGSGITDVAILVVAIGTSASVLVVSIIAVIAMFRRMSSMSAELGSLKLKLEAVDDKTETIQQHAEQINRAVNHDPMDTLVDRTKRVEELLWGMVRWARELAHHVGYPAPPDPGTIRATGRAEAPHLD